MHLALLLESFGLFAVDVALHAGLSSADEQGVPQGESAQSYCHRAGAEGRGFLTHCYLPLIFNQNDMRGELLLTWSAPRGR